MVDLYEYQGRELFARHGLPVLGGGVAETPEEARAIAERLGGRVVVKAQVKVGGRGKAGGVKLADDRRGGDRPAPPTSSAWTSRATPSTRSWSPRRPTSPRSTTSRTCSTGPTAPSCASPASPAAWRSSRSRTRQPEKVAKVRHRRDQGRRRGDWPARSWPKAAFPADVADQVVDIAVKLWQAFVAEDATLVEVNPLAKTPDGRVLCLDAKVTLDGNAGFRHPDHEAWEDKSAVDPLEQAAKAKDLNYVKLDGEVGIIGNGAGLVMSTLDVVAYAGESFGGVKPANFLDIGGGASAEVMANGLEIVLSDPSVKSVFVNVFGGITACDAVANGILSALRPAGAAGRGRSPSRWSSGWTATTPRRVGASSTRRRTRSSSGWTQWMVPRSARPSSRRRGSDDMAIWLTKDSKVIVQGMTGSEGSKHTRRMLRAGHQRRRWRHARQGRPEGGLRRHVAAGVQLGRRGDGGDRRRRDRHLRAAEVRQGRRDRGGRRGHPARRRHHRGHPGARHGRRSGRTTSPRASRPASSGRTARASPARASPTPASSRPTSPAPAASAWSPSRAR